MGKRGRKKKQEADETTEFRLRLSNGNRFGVTRPVLQIIGSPKYVSLWWNEDENLILLSPEEYLTEYTMRVCDVYYRSSVSGVELRNSKLFHEVELLYGLSPNCYAKFNGEYVPEINMVAFRLNSVSVQG